MPRGAKIVVADEDATLLQTLTWVLQKKGFEVVPVGNGADLLGRLEHERPDLLVLDLMMSQVDGLELLAKIKRDARWAELPVLVVSETAPEEGVLKSLGVDPGDFIPKPLYVIGELLRRVEMSLHANRAVRRMRDEAKTEETRTRAEMVDILREVTDSVRPEEVYRVLARRVARALGIPKCSVVLAGANDGTATVVVAYEDPVLLNRPIQLERYPEIRKALATKQVVLIDNVATDPLYERVRPEWLREDNRVTTRSAIALPFQLRGQQPGVLFLRTAPDDAPLTEANATFAAAVIEASVASIDKAWDLESAVSDKQRYEWLASTDGLTGCLNRRALQESLNREFDRAHRYQFGLAVLMVDVDHFKHVNDSRGHAAGDTVLRQVGEAVCQDARSIDVVGRYGGEEFVIALPDTTMEGAATFAERVRARIEAAAFGDPQDPLRITVSIGVAALPGERIETADALVARADAALYRAKRDGRNRVVRSTENA